MRRQGERWPTRARNRLRALKVEVHALLLAYRDPRTPWYAKAFALLVAAYAISPIDLVPDFIPFLGQLDDLLLVPLGVFLAIKMIPREVLADCRTRAREAAASSVNDRPYAPRWLPILLVAFLWAALLALSAWLVARAFARGRVS